MATAPNDARVIAEAIAEARVAKALKLAKVLIRAGADADDFDVIPWDKAAAAAGTLEPSETTKRLVLELLATCQEATTP